MFCYICEFYEMVKDTKVSGPSSAQYYTNPLSKLPHVLAHLLKSFRAYHMKSSVHSSWKISNEILRFSFFCARFNNQFGYNLITESWDHQKLDFFRPVYHKIKKPRWKQQSFTWGLPSSGKNWNRCGRRRQIWKSILAKFLKQLT